MISPIYDIKHLKQRYNSTIALEIHRLSISEGTITGLAGPNGSGKTTLLKLLAMIETPTEGTIRFKGHPALPFSENSRFHVTFLTQEPYLLKRSVFSNVAYGLKIRKASDIKDRVYHALETVGLAGDEFARRKWYELSGGEARRVALAARLALKPQVLLLDEPTANIDARSNTLIRRAALLAKKEWGTTLVISSHDLDWLHTICDDVYTLFNGKILQGGRNTIIFGPWEQHEKGLYKKTDDLSQIVVPEPPHMESPALFPSSALSLVFDHSDIPESHTGVNGVVTSLSLDKKSNRIVATVLAGEHSFNVLLEQTGINTPSFFPGSDVYVCYQPDSIQFNSAHMP